jgi:hypothetical protein
VTAAAPPAVAALDRLVTALGPGFVTTLVTGTGRPCLTVACRGGQVAEDIYVDGARFWWGWGEPIVGTGDPLTAAHRVTAALRGRR